MSLDEPMQVAELIDKINSLEKTIKKLLDRQPDPTPPAPPTNPGGGLSPEIRSRLDVIEARLSSVEEKAIPAEIVEDLIEIIRMISSSYNALLDVEKQRSNEVRQPTLGYMPADAVFSVFEDQVGTYQAMVRETMEVQARLIDQAMNQASENSAASMSMMNSFAKAAEQLQKQVSELYQSTDGTKLKDSTEALKKATAELSRATEMQGRA